MQCDEFWRLQQQENQGQFRTATQSTRILVESSNVHFFLRNTCLHAKCYIDSKVFYLKILSDNV